MSHILPLALRLGVLGLLASNSYAQAGAAAPGGRQTYTGRVVNSSLRPLFGATILVQGTPNATITNSEGAFLLTVPAGPHTLLVDYPGHLSVQLAIVRPDSALTIKLYSTQPRMTTARRRRN